MSFYRIYRPQVIADLDALSAREVLLSLYKKEKKHLPHAFLLSGPRGTGKTTTARLIAKLFRCEKPKKDGPCGGCKECLSIANGTSIDVMEIDAASNTGVDNIRELRERIALTPSSGVYKIYIIDEVHMLSTGAFNALLKTLEEPPTHAIFVLATTDREKVPVTVRSRCTEIRFQKATEKEMKHALSRVIKEEKIKIDDDAIDAIIAAADGAFRDAVKFLEQASFSDTPITRDAIQSLLSGSGTIGREKLYTSILKDRDAKEAFHLIEEMVTAGVDMKGLMTDMARDLQSMLIMSIEGKDIPFDRRDISFFLKKLTTAFADLKVTPLPQLPLELAIFDTIENIRMKYPSFAKASAGEQVSGIKYQEKEIKNKTSEIPSADSLHRIEASRQDEIRKSESKTVVDDPKPISVTGLLTLEKLVSHWSDFIEALKPYNNSVAGVMRSTRPKKIGNGVVTIEAFYKFHQERLSEAKVRDILAIVLQKLFGEAVNVEIVLGKK